MISKVAGKNVNNIAPKPFSFKSLISSKNPALNKITTNAMVLSSLEIVKILASI